MNSSGNALAPAFRSIVAVGLVLVLAVLQPATAEPRSKQRARPAAGAPALDRPAVAEGAIHVTASGFDAHPALLHAFDALNAGDLATAEATYTQVLTAEPRNADALHGLAAIALRREHHDQAQDFYLRAIDADPRDAVAQAGLAGLRGPADPVDAATRLKALIAAQPGQHTLHFALGNLHAADGRWHEARQAFFTAHHGDPAQPDYLFNLAVSLDHLQQAGLAAQYYRKALAAADKRLPGFDKAQAVVRLRELP